MERNEIWAEMAKIISEVGGEEAEWEESWLPDRQEPNEPLGAWKVQFTTTCADGTEIGGYVIITPGLLERAARSHTVSQEGGRTYTISNVFKAVARQFGDATRDCLHKDTRSSHS